jgi:hypothetical protein
MFGQPVADTGEFGLNGAMSLTKLSGVKWSIHLNGGMSLTTLNRIEWSVLD